MHDTVAQKIAMFVKKEAADLNTIDVLRYSTFVQQEKETALSPSGAIEKFSAAVRIAMRKELLKESSPKIRQSLYEKYRPNIVQMRGQALVQELGQPAFEKDSWEVLHTAAARSLEHSKGLPEKAQKKVEDEIAALLTYYKNNVVLPEKMSTHEADNQTLYVETDQNSAINKDLLHDIRLDIEASQKIPAPEKKWPQELDEPHLFTPIHFGTSPSKNRPAVYRLKDALGKVGAFLPDGLCISENLLKTFTTIPNSLLTENQKPVHHLLHIEENGKETAIAISLEESNFFMAALNERQKQNGQTRRIRLIEPHGTLVKNGEDTPWISPFDTGKEGKQTLLAAMLFKGDTQRLSLPKYQTALAEWLNEPKANREAALFLEQTGHSE
jgi:hypothetical protein